MSSIEETMEENSESCTSKEVESDDLEEFQREPVLLSSSTASAIDDSSQDVEKEEHVCEKPKRKRESKKMLPAKRSCLARFAKEMPFNRFNESPMFENPSELFKLPKMEKTPVEPSQESEVMVLGKFDREVKLRKPRWRNISKFWHSVDRYCRDITKSDTKFLNHLIAKQEHIETMCYTAHPLGDHYSLNWATKDLADEETESNPNRSRPRGTLAPTSSVLSLLQKGNDDLKYSVSLDSETVPTPLHSFLTENFNKMFEEHKEKPSPEKCMPNSSEIQLDSEILSDSNDSLSAMNFPPGHNETLFCGTTPLENVDLTLESRLKRPEKCMHNSSEIHLDSEILSDSNDSLSAMNFPPGNNATLFCGTTPSENVDLTLESRLKRDLESIGVTFHGEQIRVDDDEVVVEMKRSVALLNALGTNNIIQLKHCLKLTEVEMKKQELRQKLHTCDSEIALIHQKMHTTKLKKEPVKKRDRDQAWKLLKNREALIKEIDTFNS